MRIAQILLSPRIGGAESLAASLESDWASDGHVSQTFFLDASEKTSKFRRFLTLRSVIRKFGPDVVIAHSAIPSIYARMASSRRPVISVLHSARDDFEDPKLRIAETLLRAHTAAVVAVSQTQSERYVARYGLSVPVWVIPNGLRADLPVKSAYSEHGTQVLSIARVASQKRPDVWAGIGQLASKQGSTAVFTWYGPTSDEPNLRDVFSNLGKNTEFLGTTTDPGNKLVGADLFLHTADFEAHSIGILEAMAVGLPVVCSANVAATISSDLVVNSFSTGDVEDAMRAVRSVLDSYHRAVESALHNRDIVRDRYKGITCARKYIEVARRAIAASGQRNQPRGR